MKIKKIKNYSNKLFKLQILKLYSKKNFSNVQNNLKQIEIYFNKISNIIYKYHITNRKILFLGLPKNYKPLIKNTKHIYIPNFIWFNGMLSNRINEKNNISLNTFKHITKLKKKVDLIVICNLNQKTTAIEESYVARIPVITISTKLTILNIKTTYNSIKNYTLVNEKVEINNLLLSLIKTTLNKAKKFNVKLHLQHKKKQDTLKLKQTPKSKIQSNKRFHKTLKKNESKKKPL